jgi:hypothetical protein
MSEDLKNTLRTLLANLERQPATPPPATSPIAPMSSPPPSAPAAAPGIDYSQLAAHVAQQLQAQPQQPQHAAPPRQPQGYPLSDKGYPVSYAGPMAQHWANELATDPMRLSPAAAHQMKMELGEREARRRHIEAVTRQAEHVRIDIRKK